MCKYGKYVIDVFEDLVYKGTVRAVFETKELAEEYINLYLQGRKNCKFVITYVEYYY